MLYPRHYQMTAYQKSESIIASCPLSDTFFNIVTRWFSIIMGTGIVSILLHNLPYNGIWLYWISVVIFALNVFLFSVFLLISILRYTIYPQIWFAMIRHPAQSLFLGTFPMGLATIINMVVFVCVPAWGTWAVYLVRSILFLSGTLITTLGLGAVVVRRSDICCYLLLSSVRNVRIYEAPTHSVNKIYSFQSTYVRIVCTFTRLSFLP